jgi:hypothetical protein
MTRTTVKYSPALFLLAALLLPGDAHAQSGSQCYFDCYTYAEYGERYVNHSGRWAFARVLRAIPGRNQLPECGAP